MGAVTPGETLGTLYNIHVGSNKTKQLARSHGCRGAAAAAERLTEREREREPTHAPTHTHHAYTHAHIHTLAAARNAKTFCNIV